MSKSKREFVPKPKVMGVYEPVKSRYPGFKVVYQDPNLETILAEARRIEYLPDNILQIPKNQDNGYIRLHLQEQPAPEDRTVLAAITSEQVEGTLVYRLYLQGNVPYEPPK